MAATSAKSVKPTSRDPVTRYARQVVAGKIVAGPHVRAACQRHLDDLVHGPARGLRFDTALADRIIGFCRDVLRLNGGEFEALPYILLDWQAFIAGSLIGWVRDDGTRRFRTAYIETAKGSGKSPLAAALGLYGLTADGEAGAEVYAAATKKDQAMILFRDAVAMVDQSPALSRMLTKSGTGLNVWNLAWVERRSFFRPIASDDGQSGPRPHISLLDEVHEHRDGNVVEMLKAGQKSRRQPLTLMITNSGTDRHSVCWSYHEYAEQVAAGMRQDDAFFGYVCALDAGDDPLKNERCWPKSNPSLIEQGAHELPDGRVVKLGGIPGLRYLRDQVNAARGMPAKESTVRRLNFCEWTEAESPWIGRDVWMQCRGDPVPMEALMGRRCWGGLDLSSTQDLTAAVFVFEPCEHDPHWRQLERFWVPNEGLADKSDKDRVPYTLWRDQGHLTATEGRAINKLAVVRELAELVSMLDLQALAYDRWRIEDLKMLCEQEGISLPLQPFGQGFQSMAPAVDEYERRLVSGQVRHAGNPVMTMCAANAVISSDPAGNRKVNKMRATGRVDGTVAAVMATGASIAGATDAPGELPADFEFFFA